MASVQESIEIDVPASAAYNHWTQFETFPEFMTGVESAEQIETGQRRSSGVEGKVDDAGPDTAGGAGRQGAR